MWQMQIMLMVCVVHLKSFVFVKPNTTILLYCKEEKDQVILNWDLSRVAITSNCWVITAPQAARLNVFWLNTNDWLCICPCTEESRREHYEKSC